MNTFFKATLIVFFIILLSWSLPSIYNFLTVQKYNSPFVLYSSIINDFAIIQHDGKKTNYTDFAGNKYTQEQFDSILPFFYYRQLMADNRLPDTLQRVVITPKKIQKENFVFRHSPSDINTNKVPLYPLLESRSKRIDLKMSTDVFRLSNGEIQFIDMASNQIDTGKSERFNHVFKQKKVLFPICTIDGNPTTRKEYDEGYFFTDSNNQLFHFKQNSNSPFLRPIEKSDSLKINHIFVTEFSNRKQFAFLTDKKQHLYVVTAPNYNIKLIEVESFNPSVDNLMIIGNLFDWTLEISNSEHKTYYAIDASNYSCLKKITFPITISKAKRVGEYLFPFILTFTRTTEKWVKPHFINLSFKALILNFLLFISFLLINRGKYPIHKKLLQKISIIIFGLYAFIPLLILKN